MVEREFRSVMYDFIENWANKLIYFCTKVILIEYVEYYNLYFHL